MTTNNPMILKPNWDFEFYDEFTTTYFHLVFSRGVEIVQMDQDMTEIKLQELK